MSRRKPDGLMFDNTNLSQTTQAVSEKKKKRKKQNIRIQSP